MLQLPLWEAEMGGLRAGGPSQPEAIQQELTAHWAVLVAHEFCQQSWQDPGGRAWILAAAMRWCCALWCH